MTTRSPKRTTTSTGLLRICPTTTPSRRISPRSPTSSPSSPARSTRPSTKRLRLGVARLPDRCQLHLRQLGARRDAELHEDLPQVVVDRAGAQEELRRYLTVAGPRCDQARDLQLLRRDLPQPPGVALARRLSAGAQLHSGAFRPRRDLELFEALDRCAKMVARLAALAIAAKELPEEQLKPRVFEGTTRNRQEAEGRVQPVLQFVAV